MKGFSVVYTEDMYTNKKLLQPPILLEVKFKKLLQCLKDTREWIKRYRSL